MRNHFLSSCCAFALMLFAGSADHANAETSTSTSASLAVSLQVTAQCSIGSVNALNFGTQSLIGGPLDNAASFELKCTALTPYTVGLDAGTGVGAVGTMRKMTGAASGQTIAYELYMDEARTRDWGNDPAQVFANTGNGENQSFTVYARVPEQPAAPPDSYSDNVTLSVTY
jgi:spore coat protein U-like protein